MAKKFHSEILTVATQMVPAPSHRPQSMGGILIGIPPRAKKVQMPRRRVPILHLEEAAEPVKIIHLDQNLGTPVTDIQPVQNSRI